MSLDKLTNHFFKLAQQAPDQTLVDFAFKMMQFNPVENPGLTVDAGRLQEAGRSFYDGLVNKKNQQMLTALKTIVSLSSAGAPVISQEAKQMYQRVLQSLPKPAPVPPKKTIPEAYYQTVKELTELSKMTDLGELKSHFESSEMKDKIAALKEYFDFQEALETTRGDSKDPTDRAQFAEGGLLNGQMSAALSLIEKKLFGFAGTAREVPGPNPAQAPSSLT